MVKLKKGSIHGTLQNAIVAAINDPSYSFSLPKLSDWESIVSSSADEKERLEFVGDAIMHFSVALYLYRLFPDAAPGLYTVSWTPAMLLGPQISFKLSIYVRL